MRRILVLVASVFMASALSLAQPPEKTGAEVKGIVTDTNDSRVAGAVLIFETGDRSYRVETGEDGAYAIRLKPNTYTVSITHFGFCRSRRAAFVAKKDSQINFDFQLWVCGSDGNNFDFVELEPRSHTHLKPLVFFGESRPVGTSQVFTGAVLFQKYPVVLTYNLLTVRADKLTYERSKYMLLAEGHVEWQDGMNKGSGENVQIWLDGPEPRVIPVTRQK
jgi:hypothetical protein